MQIPSKRIEQMYESLRKRFSNNSFVIPDSAFHINSIVEYIDETIPQLQQQIEELQKRIEQLEGPEPLNPATYSEMLALRINEKLSGRINELEKPKYTCPCCHRSDIEKLIIKKIKNPAYEMLSKIPNNQLSAVLVFELAKTEMYIKEYKCKHCMLKEDKK